MCSKQRAGIPRLVYTSLSVAAYGYHDHEGLLTEGMSNPRCRSAHVYSHQKAAVDRAAP